MKLYAAMYSGADLIFRATNSRPSMMMKNMMIGTKSEFEKVENCFGNNH
jgi:hypothetical protein